MDTTFSRELRAGFAGGVTTRSARVRVARLLDHAVFTSLLILLALVAIPYGTVEAWWVAVYSCSVFFLGAVWLIEGTLTGTWGLSQRRLIIPLLGLILFTFIQTVSWSGAGGDNATWRAVSADPFETRFFAWKLLALALNGILLLRYASTERRLRALIFTVIGIGVASALFGIVRQTMQGNAQGFFLPYLQPDSGYAQFINKNHFALLMEMTLGLVSGLVVGGGVRRERLPFYGAAAFLLWTGLVLTYSRGGIFSMICQLLFLFTVLGLTRNPARDSRSQSSRRARSRMQRVVASLAMRVALSACLLGGVAASVVWMGGDVLVTRLQSLTDEVGATKAETHMGVRRREIWQATWQLCSAHPFFGSGFGGYGVAITRYHDASGTWTPEAAHNDYLELAASGGLIAVAFVLWFVLAFLKRARARLHSLDPFRHAACMGALVGLFGVAVHGVVDFGLHVTANALVFTVLIVIATLCDGDEKQTPDERQGGARYAPV